MSTNVQLASQLSQAAQAIKDGRVVDRTLFVTTESRYGDTVIRLPANWFPVNSKRCNHSLDFATIPKLWGEPVRQATIRLLSMDSDTGYQKRGATIQRIFIQIRSFTLWCVSQGYEPNTLDEDAYMKYVSHSRKLKGKKKGTTIGVQSLQHRLSATKSFYKLLKDTAYEIAEPWPDSSAYEISGAAKDKRAYQEGKTKAMPNEVVNTIFQYALSIIDNSDTILGIDNDLKSIVSDAPDTLGPVGLRKRVKKEVRKSGFKDKNDFNEAIKRLSDACAIVILITVGMRISELLSIKSGGYRREDREDITLYFIQAYVAKTGNGLSEFVAPEVAIRAIKIMEQLSFDLREDYSALLETTKASGDRNKYAELEVHHNALFLTKDPKTGRISTNTGMDHRLKSFVMNIGIDWDFSSHQARRTFALNAACSSRGDLRLLKEHFKHWSLDMTVLYAAHETADEELWDYVYSAVSNLRVETIGGWLAGNTRLAGGLAHKMMTLRASNEDVKTYGSRKKMIEVVSETVNIRSTGVAWCTAADINCGGGYGAEKARCADCSSSVIEASPHQAKWEAMLIQQSELKGLNDIGIAAQQRAERDYHHCRQVLTDLGCDVDAVENTLCLKQSTDPLEATS